MRPLDGVRVLDVTRLLPGACATLILADLGAEVVKIEDPRGGDPARCLPPVAGGTRAYFQVLNRSKRSVTLDLRSADAERVLDALVARADVLVESFRPETARRLGVDAAVLRARHPRLIHASVTGFGQTGPSARRAAHDINFQALAGLLSWEIERSRAERAPGLLIGDIGAAMHAAAGILAALFQRERTGEGSAVEVSIDEAALSWMLFPAARTLAGEAESIDVPLFGDHACYNVYRTADDRHVALGALEPKFWDAFCRRIGREDLIALQYVEGREQARALAEIRALMRTRTRDEWLTFFEGTDACLTALHSVGEALSDPHLAARGAITRQDGVTYLTTPISTARPMEVRPAPTLGADTDEILDAAGIDAADRAALRARGTI